MTLSFSQQINGKPNYFIEKIIAGIIDSQNYEKLAAYAYEHLNKFGKGWDVAEDVKTPKLHTIRRDEHNRWKEGMMIHPVINNRTPNRFQFAPEFPCTGVQAIEMKWQPDEYGAGNILNVWIDGRELDTLEKYRLSLNDGFDTFVDFGDYFNEDFKGKLIHWTNVRY